MWLTPGKFLFSESNRGYNGEEETASSARRDDDVSLSWSMMREECSSKQFRGVTTPNDYSVVAAYLRRKSKNEEKIDAKKAKEICYKLLNDYCVLCNEIHE